MNDRITISDVAIEVTRRCNMTCRHCLRGKAQNIDFNPNYLDSFFKKVGGINTLTLTGGEPSLVPHILKAIRMKIKKYKVEIGSFYLATNAKEITKKFIFELMEWYLICNSIEEGMPVVDYSNDVFHDEAYKNGFPLLNTLKFVNPKDHRSSFVNPLSGWLREGRGRRIFDKALNNQEVKPEEFTVEDDYSVSDGLVYLNCKGNVISSCNWSYHNQDKFNSPCFVCSIEDFSWEKLHRFNDTIGVAV